MTIPGALRRRLGIGEGTVLEFEEEHGKLVVRKAVTADPVSLVTGILSDRRGTDAVLRDLRGQ